MSFQLFQFFGQSLGAAFAVVVIGFVVLVKVFFGNIVVVFIGIHKTIHHGGDDDLAFANFIAHAQDFGNGGWASRNGFHHVHQTAFNALGNFNFAFACQQFHGAHFTHVHANWVGGAPKFGVHGGQGCLGFFFGFFFSCSCRRCVVEQQGFRVRGLLVNGHAHVVEHGNHHFQGFGIYQLVGQVVRDFAMGEVATGFA